MGRREGAQHAAADLVGLHLLRDDRVRRRLLRPLSVLALAHGPHAGSARLFEPRRAHRRSLQAQTKARAEFVDRSARPRSPTSARIPNCSTSPWPAAARPSRPTACSATARAAPAAPASPTWSTTTGSGAARIDQIYTTIQHGIRNADDKSRQSLMPRFGVDGLLTAAAGCGRDRLRAEPVGSRQRRRRRAPRSGRSSASPATRPTARATRSSARPTSPTASGSMAATATRSIGRSSMPATAACRRGATRLDDATMKMLAIYVHALGGGR